MMHILKFNNFLLEQRNYWNKYQDYKTQNNYNDEKFIKFIHDLNINFNDFNLTDKNFFHSSNCHGIKHTYRVMYNCLMIGFKLNNIIDTKRSFCAAFIHDLSRRHDWACHIHGEQSVAENFEKYTNLFKKNNMIESDFDAIKLAVINHSQKNEIEKNNQFYTTVSILRDADALDLIRLGTKIIPNYLRFNVSKRLIEFCENLYYDTETKSFNGFNDFLKHLIEINIYETYNFLLERDYYGDEASGVIPFCIETKRFLISLRSTEVMDSNGVNYYGIFGGKNDDDDSSPEDVCIRELEEETKYNGNIKLIPLFIFKDKKFKYYNFLGLVPNEFEPNLNWENEDAKWVTFDEMMNIKPKHFGLQGLLNDSKSLSIMKKYSK